MRGRRVVVGQNSNWGFRMEREGKQQHFRWDETHWWTRSTRWLCSRVLDGIFREKGGRLRIWDAGCGTGLMAAEAARYGDVVATDSDEEMLSFARERGAGVEFRLGEMGTEGFRECFDVVLSFDVLYHRSIEDWREALRVLVRALAPEGVLMVQVPAYAWLAGRHDEVVGGSRRFSPGELRRAVRDAGLRIRLFSHRFALLVPLVWLRRALFGWVLEEGDLGGSAGGDFFGFFIERALRLETALILAGVSIEAGSSLVVVAERGDK